MDNEQLLEQAWTFWKTGRRTEIVPFVESEVIERTVLERYLMLQGGFFWKKQDLEAVIAVTNWGLAFARSRGAVEAENVLLYNLSTFTLPWWHDSLYATEGQREAGRCAALSLIGLRERIGKSPGDMSMAFWALGAHELFAGNAPQAISGFNSAMSSARSATNRGLEACALDGLARTRALLVPEDREWGRETLKEAKAMYAEAGKEFSFNIREVERFEARAGLKHD